MLSMPLTIWTIGHSTRPIDAFIELLQAHRIQQVVDVRTIPRSRHNPQFNAEALAESLKSAGLIYLSMPGLGGLRKARKDSINEAWRNASFRGYADYMQTPEFWKALEELSLLGRKGTTAVMCAEAIPWRCHRSLIADALLSRGGTVRHIMTVEKADEHRMTPFAVIDSGRLIYPAPIDQNAPPRLF
jgi:uncharacterized protein (DUF488 family)